MWGVACYFSYNFFKITDLSFFVIQWMYHLCITNLIKSNKNNPYFFAQGGCLENKISEIRSESKWGTMNKYVGNYLLLFV